MASWSCFTEKPDSPTFLSLSDVVKIAESVGGTNHGFKYVQLPVTATIPEATVKNIPQETVENIPVEEKSFNQIPQDVGKNIPLIGRTFLELAASMNITVMSSRSIGGGTSQSLLSTELRYYNCIHKDSIYANELIFKIVTWIDGHSE